MDLHDTDDGAISKGEPPIVGNRRPYNYAMDELSLSSGQALGWIALFAGWAMFLVALQCPAIACSGPALDMGPGRETKSGLTCLCDTFNPGNWLFAPLLLLYLWGNLVILASPFVVKHLPTARGPWGVLLLIAFAFSLSTPVCAPEVEGALVGAYVWMASFLLAGLGCLLLREPEKGEQSSELR